MEFYVPEKRATFRYTKREVLTLSLLFLCIQSYFFRIKKEITILCACNFLVACSAYLDKQARKRLVKKTNIKRKIVKLVKTVFYVMKIIPTLEIMCISEKKKMKFFLYIIFIILLPFFLIRGFKNLIFLLKNEK